jgi:dTMP kinase
MLISFEGINCVGKSTQVKLLYKYLISKGIKTKVLKYPIITQSKTSLFLKKFLYNYDTLVDEEKDASYIDIMFFKNRLETQPIIRDALDNYTVVILDRYIHSGLAYSITRGLKLETILYKERGLIPPFITFYIDIPADKVYCRREHNESNYEFQSALMLNYKKLKNIIIPTNWIEINGNKNKLDIHKDIINHIIKRTNAIIQFHSNVDTTII